MSGYGIACCFVGTLPDSHLMDELRAAGYLVVDEVPTPHILFAGEDVTPPAFDLSEKKPDWKKKRYFGGRWGQ